MLIHWISIYYDEAEKIQCWLFLMAWQKHIFTTKETIKNVYPVTLRPISINKQSFFIKLSNGNIGYCTNLPCTLDRRDDPTAEHLPNNSSGKTPSNCALPENHRIWA